MEDVVEDLVFGLHKKMWDDLSAEERQVANLAQNGAGGGNPPPWRDFAKYDKMPGQP